MHPLFTYGSSDASVVRAIFQGLLIIKLTASDKNKEVVMNLAEDFYQSVADNFKREADLSLFMEIYQEIMTGSKEEKEIAKEEKEEEKEEEK